MPVWLLQLLLFFLEQILKEVLEDTDWKKVHDEFQVWARKRMPGERFDEAAAFLAGVVIDLIARALKANPDLTFRQAARIARQQLPMELAERAVAAMHAATAAAAAKAPAQKKGK